MQLREGSTRVGTVQLKHNGLEYVADTTTMFQTRSGRGCRWNTIDRLEEKPIDNKEMIRRQPVYIFRWPMESSI